MHLVDYGIVVAYLVGLLYVGLIRPCNKGSSAGDVIVGGRMMTLPAFVASLVSTWYGGILGVGEYSYRYGLSNWLVFGLPYYLAAFLFALFLARKARESELLTIPDRLAAVYDTKTSVAGAIIIFLMTVPAAYVLMVGVMYKYLFGWPLWVGIVFGTAYSVVYVYRGGFRSVVRTDIVQFCMMYLGFVVLFVTLAASFGGFSFLAERLPATHFTWRGGNSGGYVVVWYFIALATLIEPAFFQRCYAARTARTARAGIFISIGCWAIFDFLTTSCGLYARAIVPDLADPVASYPVLGMKILPAGLMGLFVLALLATVMGSVDSYSFISASTFSRDIVMRLLRTDDKHVTGFTRAGLVVSVILAVTLALFFRSVIDIWHVFGSVATPALLVPVFFSFVGKRRLSANSAFLSILLSGGVALVWYLSQYFTADARYWLDLEPIFPGLAVSLAIYFGFARTSIKSLPNKTGGLY